MHLSHVISIFESSYCNTSVLISNTNTKECFFPHINKLQSYAQLTFDVSVTLFLNIH